MKQITCPSCGAKLYLLPGSIEIVCQYCNTILLIERGIVKNTGEKSILIPFPTRFSLNNYFFAIKDSQSNDTLFGEKVIWLDERQFRKNGYKNFFAKIFVYGHIRAFNDAGFWDKWFATLMKEDKSYKVMIEEDEGIISFYKKIKSEEDNRLFDQVKKNISKNIFNIGDYFVNEYGEANIEGFEGQYDFLLSNKFKYLFVTKDLNKLLIENHKSLNIFYLKI